jgi:predicted transcriptional regulator
MDHRYDHGYTAPEKTAISIPDDLFRAADRAAKRLGLSRSQFYQRAIVHFLERKDEGLITKALDDAYGAVEPTALDALLDQMQRASVPRERW